jgi:hypothetical protein
MPDPTDIDTATWPGTMVPTGAGFYPAEPVPAAMHSPALAWADMVAATSPSTAADVAQLAHYAAAHAGPHHTG